MPTWSTYYISSAYCNNIVCDIIGEKPAVTVPDMSSSPLDINSLFKKLLDHGIINKKDEGEKKNETEKQVKVEPNIEQQKKQEMANLEAIPDLTSLSEKLLKE